MKKFLGLLIILIISFTSNIYAQERYDAVNVNVTFAENIDLTKISYISLEINIGSENPYEVKLNQQKNYQAVLTDITYSMLDGGVLASVFSSTGVIDSKGMYAIDENTSIRNEKRAVIDLHVAYSKEMPDNLTEDELNELFDKTTTKTTIVATTNEGSGDIIIGESVSSSTTLKNQDKEDIETQTNQEKEKLKKQRNNLYIVVFSIIGVIIIVIGGLAGIKIAKANK